MKLDFSGLISQNPAIEGTLKVRAVEKINVQVDQPKEGAQERIAEIRVSNYRQLSGYVSEILTVVRGRAPMDFQFEQAAIRQRFLEDPT
jgi:hypothetical protein